MTNERYTVARAGEAEQPAKAVAEGRAYAINKRRDF